MTLWATRGAVRQPAGDRPATTSNPAVLLRFIVGIVVIAVVAVAIIQVLTPPEGPPDCVPGEACGVPPPIPPSPEPPSPGPGSAPPGSPEPSPGVAALSTLHTLANDRLSVVIAFDPYQWSEGSNAGDELKLTANYPKYGRPELWIVGALAGDRAPDRLMDEHLTRLKDRFLGLARNTAPANAIQDPEIGFERGGAVSAVYAGTTDSPQGPGSPVLIFIEAATDGRVTLSAALIMTGDYTLDTSRESPTAWFRSLADMALNGVRWTTP